MTGGGRAGQTKMLLSTLLGLAAFGSSLAPMQVPPCALLLVYLARARGILHVQEACTCKRLARARYTILHGLRTVAVGDVFRTAVVERVSRSRPTAWPSTSPPRTKWTRRVPHPVLIGHAAPGRRRGHQHGGGGTLRLGQAPRGRRALGARPRPRRTQRSCERAGGVALLCVAEYSVRYRTLCALQNTLCVTEPSVRCKTLFFLNCRGACVIRAAGADGARARVGVGRRRHARSVQKLYAMTLQTLQGGGWRGSSRRSYGRSGR